MNKKSVHLSDLSAFVVSSEDSKSISESDLKGDQESYGLDWIVSSVNVVAHKQVISLRRATT